MPPENVPFALATASTKSLRRIINGAVASFKLSGWHAGMENSRSALITHIDNMCNEFNLRVHPETGELVKPS